MSTAAAPNPQTSIYETTIDDPSVEKILEERETLRQKKATAQKAFKDKTDEAKAALNGLDLGVDAPVRIGRFVVAQKSVPGRVVQFETDPTSRLQISLISESD